MKNALNKKQAIAIAAILALGLLLGAGILASDLRAGNHQTASADGRGHEPAQAADKDDHDDHGGHGHDDDDDNDDDHDAHADDRVAMSAEQIRAADIRVLTAAPAQIRTTLALSGEIALNGDRTAHIVPRVAGVVQRVPVRLGQSVKKGEIMAVLASTEVSELRSAWLAAQKRLALAHTALVREQALWEAKISAGQDFLQAQQDWQQADIALENARQKLAAIGASTDAGTHTSTPAGAALNRHEIRAPFDGVVIEKHIALGEALKEDAAIFTLSDLSTVWTQIAVPARQLEHVRVGGQVTVSADAFGASAKGTVAHVGALLGAQTRTATAHVVLANPQGIWRPGLFVTVDLAGQAITAPVAVARAALHQREGRDVVFLRTPDGFVAQPVKIGNRTGNSTGDNSRDMVEIVQGLRAGDEYAADNSFIVRSELGKDSAGHTH